MKLTVGFIGNGKSTNRYHLPFILSRRDKIYVKTIYNHRLHFDQWKKIEGIHYTDQLDEILEDSEIQVVIITLSSPLHYEYAKKVLEAGKHCVVEKPFAARYSQAKELFDMAASRGLMIQCYQNRRFDSDFLTVQKVIESGKLGDLLELEMHFDYYRPEVPENVHQFSVSNSYLYGHACHTVDQVISYFGKPDHTHYDVRQLLGEGRMNDYFDLDLYYGTLKVSVKSSYFRIKERPSFVLYGKKGMFIKSKKDRQEADLKHFYMPYEHDDFGLDSLDDYGTLTYCKEGHYFEEKVETIKGDYGYYYDYLYETIIHHKPQLVTREQTLLQMKILEDAIKGLK